MFRVFTRVGVLGAVLAAALAFAGSALANPTTPGLAPIPPTVIAGPLTVSWTPSTPDPGASVLWYQLTVFDYTAGTISNLPATFTTSKTILTQAGHTYGLRLRAGEVLGSSVLYSGSSVDVFTAIKLIVPPVLYEVYYRLPHPDPCLTCPPLELFVGDDPVIQRTRELVAGSRVLDREVFLGHYVNARGQVSAILG
jgi:hypothetical protein